MKRSVSFGILLTLALFPIVEQAIGQESEFVDVQSLIDACIKAKSPREIEQAYHAFRTHASDDQLKRLTTSTHHGIALSFTWELMLRRTFVEKEPALYGRVKLHRRSLERFLGQLEGRSRASIPPWWETILLQSTAYDRLNLYFLEDNDPYVRTDAPFEATESVWYGLNGVQVEKRESTLEVRIGSELVSVSGDMISESKLVEPGISAVFDGDMWYVALHDLIHGAFWLYCVEDGSNRIVWKTQVWVDEIMFPPVYSIITLPGDPPGMHRVQLVLTEDGHIVVFGAETMFAYVEAFRTKDGANAFRFSTVHFK